MAEQRGSTGTGRTGKRTLGMLILFVFVITEGKDDVLAVLMRRSAAFTLDQSYHFIPVVRAQPFVLVRAEYVRGEIGPRPVSRAPEG